MKRGTPRTGVLHRRALADSKAAWQAGDQTKVFKGLTRALQLSTPDNTLCINHWNVAGALCSPNGITLYWRKVLGVTKADISEARGV